MQIKSTSFTNNQPIPDQFTCHGDGTSPNLSFSAVPADAKSLALWMHDPDAPSGDFNHWIVWNLKPSTTEITEGSLPMDAIEGKNDFNKAEYGAPCPPQASGTHHYIFELFALDAPLVLPAGASARHVRADLQSHVLAHATLTGTVIS
jgi:Raf kinase inhibitor-like YbhB/YbcL family protein